MSPSKAGGNLEIVENSECCNFWTNTGNRNESTNPFLASNFTFFFLLNNHTFIIIIDSFMMRRRRGHIQLSMVRAISNLTENMAQSWAVIRVCSFSGRMNLALITKILHASIRSTLPYLIFGTFMNLFIATSLKQNSCWWPTQFRKIGKSQSSFTWPMEGICTLCCECANYNNGTY